jgi:DegV family protein with EDD domain
LVQHYEIRVAPFSFVFGETTYRDDEGANLRDFYGLLREHTSPPKTSPASPGVYLELFKELARQVPSILCVTLHGGLSSLYNSAWTAKEMAKELLPEVEIAILDSRTASMAMGFILLEAARAAEGGAELHQVLEVAEQTKDKVRLCAVLDTLEYLARSRRIPKVGSWAAALLKVKPILGISNGDVRLVGTALGKPGALDKIIRRITRETRDGKKLHAAVIHTEAEAEASAFKGRLAKAFDCAELYLTSFTPVMGMYTGPGLVGAAYYVTEPSGA